MHAVVWAAAEARLCGLPLRVLHAAPYAAGGSGAGRQHARAILARAMAVARHAEPGVELTAEHTEQSPASTLLHASAAARLLVVGMGGGNQPHEVVLGSAALDVSGRARCPVVVVRGRHRSPRDRPVLVGVGDPLTDAPAITLAFTAARRRGSRVIVLHARHGVGLLGEHLTGHDEAGRIAARDHLVTELGEWATRFPDVPMELDLAHGNPAGALLTAAGKAQLVVLGTRGLSAPARALVGSTSRELLRRSPVPVLVVGPHATHRDGGTAVVPSPTAEQIVPAQFADIHSGGRT
jgi:nucleotide-binding universal stress UspA family protein